MKSNLTSTDITAQQMQTLHRELGLSHDTTPTPVKTKSDMKAAIKADSSSVNTLMALDNDGNLFVAKKHRSNGKDVISVSKVDASGKIVDKWSHQSISQVKCVENFFPNNI